VKSIRLNANQPPARFYRGGAGIAGFRGDPPAAPHTPEDWVASTTAVRGHSPVGMTVLPSGQTLADAISADPDFWLGAAHVGRWGSDPALLVKLLDAGQRLPVHAHPHRDFAKLRLGETHGKAEAWYILRPGTVYLGLRADLQESVLREIVDAQHPDELISLTHQISVEAGDTVYVPPGLLHAIGEGVLLVEVQEPTDLSILLEWKGFDLQGGDDASLGLGFDLALQAVDSRGWSAQAIEALIVRGPGTRPVTGPVLAGGAAEYFRLDLVRDAVTIPAGFAIVIGLDGALRVQGREVFDTPAGTTTVVPAACGRLTFSGAGTALVARPPGGA